MTTHYGDNSANTATHTATLLDDWSAHPEIARLFSDFRREAFAILNRNVNELIGKLGEKDRINANAFLSESVDAQRLATASRQSTHTIQVRRKLARGMLIAGLYNRHNPAWNLADATTYQTEIDDLIVLLMQRPDPLCQQTMMKQAELTGRA